MEPRQVVLCMIHSAIKWPNRLSDIMSILPSPSIMDHLHATMWRSIQRAVAQGGIGEPIAFRDRVLIYVAEEESSLESTVQDWIHQILHQDEPNEICCMDIIRKHALHQIMQSMSSETSPDEVDTLMGKVCQINALARGRSLQPVDLFANDGRDMLEIEERPCTGFFMMDEPFGGGLFPKGKLVMSVMPTKGGKTLHAFQLSKHMVERALSVLCLNFEQVAKGDLAGRLFSQMTDTTLDIWKGIACFSDAPREQQAMIERVQAAWTQYFKFLAAGELASNDSLPNGTASIAKLIDDLYISRGESAPDIILVDWWRDFWDKYVATLEARGVVLSSTQLRQREITELKNLKLMAQTYGTRVLVYAQLRDAISATSFNIDRLSVQDAAENKGLARVIDAGFVSTTKDPTTCIVHQKLALSRFGGNDWKTSVVMDGDRGRFLPGDGTQSIQSSFAINIPGGARVS